MEPSALCLNTRAATVHSLAMMLCISSLEPGCVTFAAVSVPGAVRHGLAAQAYPTEDRLAVMLSGASPCLLVPA